MEIQDINSAELGTTLTETKTDVQQYEVTDSQLSDTASIQYEFLSGERSVLTL